MAKRATRAMPADVAGAIEKAGARAAYEARPNYQRNDYLGWIAGAKSDQTRDERIAQMIDELERGGVYMDMAHKLSAKPRH